MPATVTVVLPAALLLLFPGCLREVAVAAETVDAAIGVLDARWPGLRGRLCDERPAIRRHIQVFVGGERAGLATRLEAGAEMVVLMAISGG